MSKIDEKKLAIQLRKKGESYSEILSEVSVAKSTLSVWLRPVGLSKPQKQRLTKKRLAAMRRGAARMRALRMERWHRTRDESAAEVTDLTQKERWLVGIALYWAEGSKEKIYGTAQPVKFSNSDYRMIQFFRYWVLEFLPVTEEALRYELYIHVTADWRKARRYWAERIGIDPKRVVVYFKRNRVKVGRKNTGHEYHGLVRINVRGGVHHTRKIEGWIDGMFNHSGVV